MLKIFSRKLVKFVVVPIVLLLVFIALLPTLLSTGFGRSIVEGQIGGTFGTEVAIGDLDAGWRSGIALTDFVIDNPEGFSSEKFLTAKTIDLRPALFATMRGRTHAEVVLKDVRMRIEKAADGRTNAAVIAANARGEKKDAPDGEEDADRDVPMELTVRIERLDVEYVDASAGTTRRVENATMDLSISGDRPNAYAGALKLAIDRVVGWDLVQPRNIVFEAGGQGGLWSVERADVPLAEGSMSFTGTVGFVDRSITASIKLADVGLGSAVPLLDRVLPILHGAQAAGVLSATVDLTGNRFDLDAISGRGNVEVVSARISGNPLVDAILQVSGGSRMLAFDRLATSFEILPGLGVATTPVRVKGGDVDFEIGGTVSRDGALDYRIGVRPKGRDWDKVREFLGDRLLEIPVKGTLASPEVQMPDPSSLLEGALKGGLEKGIEKGLEDIFKKGR